MFYPQSGNNEFIEVYNLSSTLTFDLSNYKIKIQTSNEDIISDAGFGTLLAPLSYAVIFEGDYDLSSGIYSKIISSEALLLKIADNSFGASGMSNSSDRTVCLKNSNGDTIDSHTYTADNNIAASEEKIILNKDSSRGNWGNSLRINGSPGFRNSVTPCSFDLAFSSLSILPKVILEGENAFIHFIIKNSGRNNADQYEVEVFNDLNGDSSGTGEERIFMDTRYNLSAEDSAEIIIPFADPKQGTYHILCKINFPKDEDPSNNIIYKTFYVYPPGNGYNDIVINEIMFSPINGEPEWIELYNNSESSISLKNWSVCDVLTVSSEKKITEDIYIRGKSFLVISKDSAIINYHRLIPSKLLILNFPNLNNDGDGIVLKDTRGMTIDSTSYESSWGKTGYSLERISLSASSTLVGNWTSSIDIEMSTPGRINSSTPKLNDLSVSEISFTPRFPAEGEDVMVQAKIKNNGSLNASDFKINFFWDSDLNGTADHNLGSLDIPFLSTGDSLTVASPESIKRIHTKVLGAAGVIFSLDEDTLNNYAERYIEPGFSKNTLLLNEIMFDPEENEPEWIEIINASTDTVNLINWSISDILPSPGKNFIANKDLFISPGELIIIAKDTSFLSAHPETRCKIIFTNFGNLSNSSDGIMIYDFRNAVIDSLLYRSSWGNVKGYSLERISLSSPSYDSSNWSNSLSVKKSTPGFANSMIGIPVLERNAVAINEIMFDPDIDNSEFVEFYNQAGEDVNIGGWRIEDQKGNFSKICETNFFMPANSFFVLFADSIGAAKYNLYGNLSVKVLNCGDLGLTNTGELILLRDAKGRIIDSVWYSEKWHNRNYVVTKNRSLERINPKIDGNNNYNWSSSTDFSGATPGKRNSIFTETSCNEQAKIWVSPNPFSPDGDGFEDFTIINYKLSRSVSQVRIKVFDSRGRLIRTLLNNQAVGSNNSVIFNGLEDNGSPLRIGIYIIFLEAIDEASATTEILKTAIVVARKLN